MFLVSHHILSNMYDQNYIIYPLCMVTLVALKVLTDPVVHSITQVILPEAMLILITPFLTTTIVIIVYDFTPYISVTYIASHICRWR